MKKIFVLRLLCFIVVATLLISFVVNSYLADNSDGAYVSLAKDLSEYVFEPPEEELSRDDLLCKIEELYTIISSCLEEWHFHRDIIGQQYSNVLSALVCSDANRYFNRLAESYDTYLDLSLKLQTYASLYRKYYDQINSNVITSIESIDSIFSDDTLLAKDEENVISMHDEAQRIADEFFERDYPLMCRLVTAEGGNCPKEEQCFIANVAENRQKYPGSTYPNTLYEVVYQHNSKGEYQYAVVPSGAINMTPYPSVCKNMEEYMRGRIETGMPDNVVFQAKFPQGSQKNNPWRVMESGHWFCYM